MMYMKKPWRQVLYAMVFIHDNRILAKRGFYYLTGLFRRRIFQIKTKVKM